MTAAAAIGADAAESPPGADVLAATAIAEDVFATIASELRRARRTAAPQEAIRAVSHAFWTMVASWNAAVARGPIDADIVRTAGDRVRRWLCLSSIWRRSYYKPFGYAGDFDVIDRLYRLANGAGNTPGLTPPFVACLDALMRQVDSVVALWERRGWLSNLLLDEYHRHAGCLRVLDVAVGSGAYLADLCLAVAPGPGLRIRAIDQDPTAVAYATTRTLAAWPDNIRVECGSVKRLSPSILDEQYDVVITSGLADYLDDGAARAFVAQIAAAVAPGGVVALTNFHPSDRSRLVKEWIVEWRLDYKTEEQCVRLFDGTGLDVTIARSTNGSLVLVKARDERALVERSSSVRRTDRDGPAARRLCPVGCSEGTPFANRNGVKQGG